MDKEIKGLNEEDRDWFSGWFGTDYYNLLYRERSVAEAGILIGSLRKQNWFHADLQVLDLGCGNGRHALALAPYVKKITGLDLSETQLKIAEQSRKGERCDFVKGDMRDFQLGERFDLVLNMFTSFGYFDNINDNLSVLQRVRDHLHSKGVLILDYLNATWVRTHINPSEKKIIEGIEFKIDRSIENDRVHKTIQVAGRVHKEIVTLFTKEELMSLLKAADLLPWRVCGNYQLEDFNEQTSQRCIIFARPL